jgi:hypothetical protein
VEFIDVHMRFLVVSQDPFLPELRVAIRVRADEFRGLVFLMSRQMVRQMLRHFEAFQTPREPAFIESHRQMAFEMLAELRVLQEHFAAVLDRAFEVLTRALKGRVRGESTNQSIVHEIFLLLRYETWGFRCIIGCPVLVLVDVQLYGKSVG